MPCFAVNLSMLFKELPFLERFAAARRAGFTDVEIQFPYDFPLADVAKEIRKNEQRLILINLPAGDWGAGDRGLAGQPGREEEFRSGVEKSLEWVRELGISMVNCLAGLRNPRFSEEEQLRTLSANVAYAAEAVERAGALLTVEFLNSMDAPGFLLNCHSQVLKLIEKVGHSNVSLQYDFYHAQVQGENIPDVLCRHIDRISHVQIADFPGRHQPGTGRMNFPFLLGELDRLGYKGLVALEYVPVPDTGTSLQWMAEYGRAADGVVHRQVKEGI